MRYPRLTTDSNESEAPAVYRFPRSIPGRGASGVDRVPHEAERAVDRVQNCLDQLDALMDAFPFQRFEPDDDGPCAA
jgi:hypothetical protein